MKVFVYGTLKEGGRLNGLMDGEKLFDDVVGSHTLYTNGFYPVAKQCSSNGSYIHGEVWDITPESLSLIRGIELGAGYKEGIIITEHDYPAFYFYGEEGSFQSFTHLGSVFEVNK